MEQISLDEMEMQGVIPTGIPSLDPLLFGGLPPGSLVLLIGESGAGCEEFTYTSITRLSRLKTSPEQKCAPGITLPKHILYITLTRRKEDIIQDISRGFARDMRSELQMVHFTDLSDIYFNKSLVPVQWYSKHHDTAEQTKSQVSDNILTALSDRLDQTPNQSLIVLNTLTELATQFPAKTTWPEFTAYLRGLQRALKMWGSCMYLMLTHGILTAWQEHELGDISDAVIHFQWEVTPTAKRQRVLFIDKFRGVLPQLEENELMKFSVKIAPSHGFEVSNIRAII